MNYRGAWPGMILGASVLLAAPAGGLAQQPQLASALEPLPPPQKLPTGPAVPATSTLQQELAHLHAELADLTAAGEATGPVGGDGEAERLAQIARLRARVQELILRIRLQRTAARKPAPPASVSQPAVLPTGAPPSAHPASPPSAPSTKPVPPAVPPAPPPVPSVNHFDLPAARIGKAVDPWALAQALFESHDHENALKAYRVLEAGQLGPGERVTVQYMIACCLRNLGKRDEAATLFREVANSRDNDMLADCARWQLHALRWRKDLDDQLANFRQRRQALESKP